MIANWIDAWMLQDPTWLPWLEETYQRRKGGPDLNLDFGKPLDRVSYFLALCDSDRRTGTSKVSEGYLGNLGAAFAALSRPASWQWYLHNDLPLIRDLPEIIREVASKLRLSKAQRRQRTFDLWLSCHTQEEIAEAVGLPRTTIEEEVPVLTNLDRWPNSSKLLARFQEPDWSPPLYTVWSFARKTNAVEQRARPAYSRQC